MGNSCENSVNRKLRQSKEVLSLIETSIKKGNADIVNFGSNLLSELKKINNKKELKELIKDNLSQKNIYFVRHAESEHNVLERQYMKRLIEFDKINVYDPKLSPDGIKQTNELKKKIKEKKIHFDSVFISPLSRAMQTYFLIEDAINNDADIIVTDFVREVLSMFLDKNKGKELSKLKEENKNKKLNFEFMTKEYWWFDKGENIDSESEDDEEFSLRLKLFLLWITFRPDKNILIISHSHVFIEIQESYGIYNADMVLLDKKDLFDMIISFFDYDK